MPEESAARFRFKINDVFTITGRGTAVVGFIEQGVVRAAIVSSSSAATGTSARSSRAPRSDSSTGPGGSRVIR